MYFPDFLVTFIQIINGNGPLFCTHYITTVICKNANLLICHIIMHFCYVFSSLLGIFETLKETANYHIIY